MTQKNNIVFFAGPFFINDRFSDYFAGATGGDCIEVISALSVFDDRFQTSNATTESPQRFNLAWGFLEMTILIRSHLHIMSSAKGEGGFLK